MTNEATSKLFEKLKHYKNYSNDSIFFKYIYDETDLHDENSKKSMEEDDESFKPEFTHQIFGDDEIIFGYKNLHIDYFLTPGTLEAYIGVKSREKISPSRFDGIEPDDVYSSFQEFGCSPGFTKNLDQFCSDKLKKDLEFVPWGNKIYEYTREVESKESKFEVYKMDGENADYLNEKFVDYILRVQTMLVYYIETSCFLDTEDTNWTYYLLYEKRKNTATVPGKQNNDYRYITIGYFSVYNYYAYPDKTRSRISQVMIFPKHQNLGHGAELTECVIKDVYQNPNIVDVTAESPSPEFVRLRDYVTTKMCNTLQSFKNKEMLKKGFNTEMANEALKNFKIPKLQSRRCYEILRLACTNQHNAEDWKSYRLDLKKRFFKPFLNKAKYARNAGGMPKEEEEEPECGTSKSLEDRFGAAGSSSSSKFDAIEEDDESEAGITTIGFGGKSASKSNSKPTKMVSFGSRFESAGSESTTQIGFGNSSTSESTTQIGFCKPSGTKSVSFSSKVTAMPTAGDKDSDTAENEDEESKNPENLFISEKARKEYLEQQFQEAIDEYTKIINRLEHNRIDI